MKLQDPSRELVYRGALNKRGGSQGDSGDLLVYLFDHALLMVKQKSKHEQYKVYRRVNSPLHSSLPLLVTHKLFDCIAHSIGAPLHFRSKQGDHEENFRSWCALPASDPNQGRWQRRLFDHICTLGAKVLPNNTMGEHFREPSQMGGDYNKTARFAEGTEYGL